MARKKNNTTDEKPRARKASSAVANKKTTRSVGRKKIVARKSVDAQMRAPKTAEGMYCFYLNDGRVLATLAELHEALANMSEEQYGYHTTDRNDFATWVGDVLDEAETARALWEAANRKGAMRVIKETLALYY